MNLLSAKRITKLGLVNFWRHKMMSITAIIALSLCLLVITSFSITTIELKHKIASVKEKIDLVVYFNDEVPEDEIKSLQLKISNRIDVNKVTYISKSEALSIFQNRPTSDKIKSLITPDNNPLPRSIQITPSDQNAYDNITTFFSSPTIKDKIFQLSSDENAPLVRSLNNLLANEIRNGYIFAAIFITITMIILINTLRMILFSRRNEIEIMRLVGASNIYIQLPFIIESIIYALISCLLSASLLFTGVKYNIPVIPNFISTIFSKNNLDINLYVLGNIYYILLYQLLLGILITTTCSLLSVKKRLKI